MFIISSSFFPFFSFPSFSPPQQTGKGGTSEWVLSALTSQTTLCINWEVALPDNDMNYRRPPCIQIVATYTLPNGQRMLRTTTIDFRFVISCGNSRGY